MTSTIHPVINKISDRNRGSERHLPLTICVTGWLSEENPDIAKPWEGVSQYPFNGSEPYVLKFDTKKLLELGNFVKSTLKTQVVTSAGNFWVHPERTKPCRL